MPLHSVLNAIGNSVCVQTHNLIHKHVNLYAKLDFLSPSLSSQDRFALAILEHLESELSLQPGTTLLAVGNSEVEISLAMICAQRRYHLILIMSSTPSPSQSKLLRMLGVEFIAWPAAQRHQAIEEYAQQLAAKESWRYVNPAKILLPAHGFHDSTAFELLNSFSEITIDYLIIPEKDNAQTQYLLQQFKRYSPATKIILCRIAENAPSSDNYQINEQQIQQCLENLTLTYLKIPVRVAKWGCLLSSQKEGLLTGLKGGSIIAAAVALAQQLHDNQTIVCLLPDHIESYLHSEAFDFSAAGFGLPEVHITHSLPEHDGASTQLELQLPVIEVEEAEALITDITIEMFKQFINNPSHPVVMFGLERCEFCWATRILFRRLDIAVHCVDLDSAAYQPCQLGDKMLAALKAHTECSSLPQVFIHGEFIGNSLEVFDMVNNQSLLRLLDKHQIPFNRVINIDPYTLLPGWMHDHSF